MKKRFLATLILATISSHATENNYVIVVSEKENNYEVRTAQTVTEYTSWENIGEQQCSVDISVGSVYYGTTFKQKETCVQNIKRDEILKYVYDDGTERIISSTVINDFDTVISNHDLTGTHLEETCKDILNNSHSRGTGEYVISQSGNPTVYCEMNRNGGGWMRVVNYDWYTNRNYMPSNLDNTTNKNISYAGSNFLFPDAWWVHPWGEQAANTNRWIEVNAQPIYAWTESMIDFEGLGFRSLDEFTNIHNNGIQDRDSVNGQYLDGFSFTYGNNGSREHLYSVSVGYSTPSEGDRLSGDLSWIGSYYDHKSNTDYMSGFNSFSLYSKNIIGKIKPIGNEKVSLRLMADQIEGDESIGMRKYILWVR